jgi:hypothetical protein
MKVVEIHGYLVLQNYVARKREVLESQTNEFKKKIKLMWQTKERKLHFLNLKTLATSV